jgi:hypothetical protein
MIDINENYEPGLSQPILISPAMGADNAEAGKDDLQIAIDLQRKLVIAQHKLAVLIAAIPSPERLEEMAEHIKAFTLAEEPEWPMARELLTLAAAVKELASTTHICLLTDTPA